jgi:hypothetical protein
MFGSLSKRSSLFTSQPGGRSGSVLRIVAQAQEQFHDNDTPKLASCHMSQVDRRGRWLDKPPASRYTARRWDMLWIALGLAALSFLIYRGGRVWMDAGRCGFDLAHRCGWALLGAVIPSRYWWGPRIGMLSFQAQADLLTSQTNALGLSRADSLTCPLCGAEVLRAWTLTSDGDPTVAPGPVECSSCDFRLDACRHCAHFLPGAPQAGGQFGYYGAVDMTFGRCARYKMSQPIEKTCPAEVARRLRAQGWVQVRAPIPIVDSFVPPDFCTAFAPNRKRLRAGAVRWPDVRRTALLRLLASYPSPKEPPADLASDDEQWLL